VVGLSKKPRLHVRYSFFSGNIDNLSITTHYKPIKT